ncbi:MAG: hypothetical protein UX74_C0026G0014 [Parcubacteria group bacterium GW2011_GWA2_47_10b]|nr:MAG: hypothetical protein UX74_C0026G0014 [Parcubacteria group bacterium GW2011_GWA2_47_10b]
MVQELTSPPAREYWVYHNVTSFLASIVFAYALFQTNIFREFLSSLGAYGYLGSFLTGIFFVSSFTVVPATAALILFSENLDFLLVGIFAGAGATIGDFFVFRFVEDGLGKDLRQLFTRVGNGRVLRIFQSKFFGILTPVIGALIIASPLPDELGVGLLGISRMDWRGFLVLSFVLNSVGIAAFLGVVGIVS